MNALHWATSSTGSNPPNDFYCTTRDVGQARVEKLVAEFIRQSWNSNEAGLLAAVIGELVGNCFDHNLGKWRDVPGCWLETIVEREVFRAIVADRGQGVLATLRQVLPELQDDKQALLVAFTKNITGRAPEQRGNGLKFVIRSLGQLNIEAFQYQSGTANFAFAGQLDLIGISRYIDDTQPEVGGTYFALTVRKSL
ncbi:MAG: hypothetical protein Q7N87_00910 [Candidatus Uhrbacteria bacterium]|nr:hypothetical protein [Candidatus Uhrbacteria bacterium]